jgi:protoporphyrinogen oxidase
MPTKTQKKSPATASKAAKSAAKSVAKRVAKTAARRPAAVASLAAGTAAATHAQAPHAQRHRVVVAGGGIAGITAALKLAQAGYQVTLYEQKPWLGGNIASHQDAGSDVYHDVYPHMFSNFYVNFWDIVEKEIGLKRDLTAKSDFEPRNSFKFLDRSGYSTMAVAKNPIDLLRDMYSGVAHVGPLDIYLYLYSMLDLLAHRFGERGLLGLSVNGYIRSRPCVTKPVAQLHDAIVTFIWSIHSSGTSASSYQNFYRHTFGNVSPMLWLLRGSLQEKVIDPLERRLVQLGVKVVKGVSVQGLEFDGNRVTGLDLRRATRNKSTEMTEVLEGDRVRAEPFDHLVLAVPPKALGHLADSGTDPKRRLSTAMPKLSHAGKRLPSEPIAVMDVYFKVKLVGIPPENIAITDSDCYMSIIDLSQLWPSVQKLGVTALTLAASDYWALPSDDDELNGLHMIRELAQYLPYFKPPQHWGDEHSDIDWSRTAFHSNKDDVIFVNQVGSWEYRPETHMPDKVSNLYFAGDFCRNQVDMATVEAATTSGINAAMALQASAPRGKKIELLKPPIVPDAAVAALKLLMAPSAYMAKAWLTLTDTAQALNGPEPDKDVLSDLTHLARLPMDYVADSVGTLGSLAQGLLELAAPTIGRRAAE